MIRDINQVIEEDIYKEMDILLIREEDIETIEILRKIDISIKIEEGGIEAIIEGNLMMIEVQERDKDIEKNMMMTLKILIEDNQEVIMNKEEVILLGVKIEEDIIEEDIEKIKYKKEKIDKNLVIEVTLEGEVSDIEGDKEVDKEMNKKVVQRRKSNKILGIDKEDILMNCHLEEDIIEGISEVIEEILWEIEVVLEEIEGTLEVEGNIEEGVNLEEEVII